MQRKKIAVNNGNIEKNDKHKKVKKKKVLKRIKENKKKKMQKDGKLIHGNESETKLL